MRRRQGNLVRGQEGMASFVVVSILIVLLTLISLGFARLMERASQNARNQQAATAATYAAESGINDVATYIKKNPTAKSDNCVGTGSLIGSNTAPGPFYNDANLSGDNFRSTQYTCLLLNQTPQDLVYQNLPTDESRIIKATTSAFAGALDKMMISWQPTNSQLTGYPPATTPLLDATTWNSTTDNYIPMLRVTLYPIPVGGSVSAVQQNSRTFFLYPQAAAGTVPTLTYSAITDGSLIPIHCTNSVAAGSFNGTADYTCNVILNSLSTSTLPDKIDYFYIKVMPIYSHADIKIKTNDIWGQSLNFIHVQAMVDITAKSDSVAKRLQARLDLGGVGPSGSTITSYNIAPADNDVPDFTVRSANAICKRLLEYNSYYNYAQVDGPIGICNQLNNTVYTPAPTLGFSVVGNNGRDNNLRVCGSPWNSVDQQVWGCPSANNPNGGDAATVYVGQPGAGTIYWRSEDAANSCNLSGYGDVNPISTWTADPAKPGSGTVIGSGNRYYSGLTSYSTYSMTCQGPGGSTPTQSVNIWPAPYNSNGNGPGNPSDSSSVYFTGPASYHAGDPYQLSFHTANATSCQVSGGGSSEPWNTTYSVSPSGQTVTSPTFYTKWNDNQTKYYTVTCSDNIGRSASANWTVATSGSYNTHILPPVCTATASFGGSTPSDAYITWFASCPEVSQDSGYYYTVSNVPGVGTGYTSAGYHKAMITQPGTYNFDVYTWAPGWRSQSDAASYSSTSGDGYANSGTQSITIHYQVVINSLSSSGLWDQSPECSYPNAGQYHWADRTWWCWRGRNPPSKWVPGTYQNPGCVDGVHQWTLCTVYWSVSAGSESSSLSCTISSWYGNFISATPSNAGYISGGTWYGSRSGSTYPNNGFGWGGANGSGYTNPNYFNMTCSTPWASASTPWPGVWFP